MNPTQQITKEEFNKKYWFNSLQMVTVLNPKLEDWPFMVEMRHFIIKSGATERFPGVIANVYLDQMSKILAQDDDKLGYMADPSLKRLYYDKLIIDVEELVSDYSPTPEYLRNVPQSAQGTAPSEKAPWEENMERASTVAPNVAPAPPVSAPELPEEPEAPPKPETKEFEVNGSKYKSVINKNGNAMFYKNGQMTTSAEYNRAASML